MKVDNTIVKSFRGFRTLGLFGVLFCLIGCSGEQIDGPGNEPQPATEQAIAFSADLPEESEEEAMTRAGGTQGLEEVLPDGNKKFTVWGYKNMSLAAGVYGDLQTVFPGYTVNWEANTAATTTSNTNDWEYVGVSNSSGAQTIKFWDFSAKAYRFFAYALGKATVSPATDPSTVTEDTSDDTKVSFTTTVNGSTQAGIDAAPYFSHLWFSTNELPTYSSKQYGRPVTLEFIKPFARVRFMFTFADGLSIGREKLSLIRFYPTNLSTIATAGTVSVTYPLTGTGTTETWTITNATSSIPAFLIDYYETPSPPVTPADGQSTTWPNSPEHWYTVLPNTSQGTYTVEVAVVTSDVKSAVVPAAFMQWKPGYQYTYIFKINEGGGITMDIIQVAINDWSNPRSSEHAVYNW